MPGADGRAAERQLAQPAPRPLGRRDRRCCDLRGVAAEFLPQPDRRRVLQVRAADLDDVVELRSPCGRAPRARCSSAGISVVVDRDARRDVHRGGDHVVGDLLHVDVVVGVDRLLAAALAVAISLARLAITSLAFMLVEVPLPVWKMSTTNWSSSLPSHDFLRRLLDQPRRFFVEEPRSMFTSAQAHLISPIARDEAAREAEVGDREILDGPRGLRPVVRVGGDLHFAHRVFLEAMIRHDATPGMAPRPRPSGPPGCCA